MRIVDKDEARMEMGRPRDVVEWASVFHSHITLIVHAAVLPPPPKGILLASNLCLPYSCCL